MRFNLRIDGQRIITYIKNFLIFYIFHTSAGDQLITFDDDYVGFYDED